MQLPAFVSIDEDGDLFIELVHPTTRIHITIPENGNGAWAYIGSKPWALHHGSLGNETQEVLVALVEDLIKATASERE